MKRWGWALLATVWLAGCPDEAEPRVANTATPVAPEAIPTEADFEADVAAEITDENYEAKLAEIEAAIQSDKSK